MAAALLLVVGLGETRRTTRILCDVEHNTERCLLALTSLGFVQERVLMEITFHVLNFKEKSLRWSPESSRAFVCIPSCVPGGKDLHRLA